MSGVATFGGLANEPKRELNHSGRLGVEANGIQDAADKVALEVGVFRITAGFKRLVSTAQYLDEQRLFGAEITKHPGLAKANCVRELLHGSRAVALLINDRQSGFQDLRTLCDAFGVRTAGVCHKSALYALFTS